MITTPEDYLKYLYLIQDQNFPKQAILLPTDETIYEIDLKTRTIQAPEILSAERDHQSETVYFKVDRYFDNMDLTKTVCLVQYINKNAVTSEGLPSEGYIYAVPFYDVEYFKDENKILIPWCIEGMATQAAGPVEFAINFYLLNDEGSKYLYNLNTQIATSKVLHGMNVITDENEYFIIPESENFAKYVLQELAQFKDQSILKWIDA